MRKIVKKAICMGVMLIVGVCVLCACNDHNESNKYNAVILDRANILLKNEFLQSLSSYGGEFGEDTVLTIKDQAQFDEIFVGFPTSLDFDKEQLAVCVYTDINYGYPCGIKNIDEDNGVLKITLYSDLPRDDRGTPPCTSSPTQRAVVIKMNRTDFSDVKITWG